MFFPAVGLLIYESSVALQAPTGDGPGSSWQRAPEHESVRDFDSLILGTPQVRLWNAVPWSSSSRSREVEDNRVEHLQHGETTFMQFKAFGQEYSRMYPWVANKVNLKDHASLRVLPPPRVVYDLPSRDEEWTRDVINSPDRNVTIFDHAPLASHAALFDVFPPQLLSKQERVKGTVTYWEGVNVTTGKPGAANSSRSDFPPFRVSPVNASTSIDLSSQTNDGRGKISSNMHTIEQHWLDCRRRVSVSEADRRGVSAMLSSHWSPIQKHQSCGNDDLGATGRNAGECRAQCDNDLSCLGISVSTRSWIAANPLSPLRCIFCQSVKTHHAASLHTYLKLDQYAPVQRDQYCTPKADTPHIFSERNANGLNEEQCKAACIKDPTCIGVSVSNERWIQFASHKYWKLWCIKCQRGMELTCRASANCKYGANFDTYMKRAVHASFDEDAPPRAK